MTSLATSYYRPKTSQKRPANAIPPMPAPMPTPTPPASQSDSSLKKPMRPLTAYHIFFQLEREFIIQSMAGPDADKTMHDNKSYIRGVPRKYRSTKLMSDWCAGPGKRTKRKHRKSHGKIGFLELSRVISKRWATLESNDPETKQYVSRIAAGHLAEYKVEMKQFKELTKIMAETAEPETLVSQPLMPHSDAAVTSAAIDMIGSKMISPSASPTPNLSFHPIDENSPSCNLQAFFSLDSDFTFASSSSSCVEEEIDYSICSKDNNGHYIPSPGPATNAENMSRSDDGSFCDPLFELDSFNDFEKSIRSKRCVSPVVSSMNVDVVLFDKDVLQMSAC